MIEIAKTNFFNVVPPQAVVNNAAYTCNVIDTAGYDYCTIVVTTGATDAAYTVFKVQESDTKSNTTALTSGADVTGLVFGTSADIAGNTSALPSSTSDNKVYLFEVDCRGRKRYLLPAFTVGGAGTTGAFLSCTAILSRAKTVPVTAADRNVGDILRV